MIETNFAKSRFLFENGKIDQAIDILKAIIAEKPGYVRAYYSLGYAYMEKNQNSDAEHILQKAIELRPDWSVAHLQLGKAYENQQKWELALASYRQAVTLEPDNLHAHMHLGIMYHVLDEFEASADELQVAYQAGLRTFEVIYNLVTVLHKLGEWAEALNILNDTLEASNFSSQDLAQIHNLQGYIYLYLEQLDEAYRHIKQAIELDPTKPWFFINLGDICFEKEEWEEAISWYEKATTSSTNRGEAFRGIGNSYLRLENWQKAAVFLEKARDAGCIDFFSLGFVYFELGDDKQGIENFKNEILNDGPAKIQASYYLGFAYAVIGDQDASIKTFKQFLEFSRDKGDDPDWEDWRLEAENQIDRQSP